MLKKVVSGITLTLLLTSMFVWTFKIQPVSGWTGTIYIRADGSVDPPDAPINRSRNIYTLTGDIFDGSIVVECDNIILDGNRHVLSESNNQAYGINLAGCKNVTITNFTILGFTHGVFLSSSSYNKIVNNTLTGCRCYGIFLSQSSHNYLANNTIMNCTVEAINLDSSNYNTLIGNTVVNNFAGISLIFCTKNTLRQNRLKGNRYSFRVCGLFLSNYIHDVDTSNIIDEKPIVYWINRFNETIPSNAGYIVVVNSSMITVKDLKLTNNFYGVIFAFTKDSLIKDIEISESRCGIYLETSDFNMIIQNNVTAINGPGILLDRSNYNTIAYNHVSNVNSSGIWLEDTYGNEVIGNHVEYSKSGWPQEYDGAGVLVDDSRFCKVIQNNLIRNKYGIVIGASPAYGNLVIRNNIVMNDIGLVASWGRSNVIYNNNFIENAKQVHVEFGSSNKYDDGYPSGGNYWSDYTGVDLFSGPYQNITGSDGIGDASYVIDEDNVDNYPLMGPFSSFNTSAGYSVDVVSNSTVEDFRYFESNSTIVMHVSNMTANQTIGFCRLTIPHDVISPPYTVKVNDTTVECKTIYENYTEGTSIIYFSYEHSKLEITVIPECPPVIIIPLFTLTTIIATILLKIKRKPKLSRLPKHL